MPRNNIRLASSWGRQQQQQRRKQHHPQSHWQNSDEGPPTPNNRSILWIPAIFLASAVALYFLSHGLTRAGNGDDDQPELEFPTSVEDIRLMSSHLVQLKEQHFPYLLLLFSCAYVFKQTFAIPGSFFLNLLGGVLFGPYLGFGLCCLLNAIGATFCFLLSQFFGKAYVISFFPGKVEYFRKEVHESKDSLFFFLLGLRLFPMSPNWAINIVCPIVGVPVHLFFTSVFIGMMPYNFICNQTGSTLSQISSINDVFTLGTMCKLALLAVLGITPGLVIKCWHRSKQD